MLIADPIAPTAAQALEIPAVIAGSVNLLRFSAALAQAGLIGRHDASRAWPNGSTRSPRKTASIESSRAFASR